MNWRSPSLPWIASLISGVLLALCFEPWNHGVLLWVWQIPFFAVLWFYDLPIEHDPPRILKWTSGGRVRRILFFPLNFLLRPATSERRWAFGFKVGLLTGFIFFLCTFWWIGAFVVSSDSSGLARFAQILFGGSVAIALCGYLAVYFAIWGAFTSTLGRLRIEKIAVPDHSRGGAQIGERSGPQITLTDPKPNEPSMMTPSFHSLWIALLCSSCWVVTEWLRGWVLGGFGWNGLAVALQSQPNLIQIVDVVGVTGLSFLPVFCTSIALTTLARFRTELGKGRMRPHVDFGIAMLLVILTFFYGLNSGKRYEASSDDQTELKIVLIQGAVPVEDRWFKPDKFSEIFSRYRRMTEMYAGSDIDLAIWPETALPYPLIVPDSARLANDLMTNGGFELVLGSEEFQSIENLEDVYNGLFLINKPGDVLKNSSVYRKHYLVPFGEFMPFRNFGVPGTRIKPIHWLVQNWLPHDFKAGDQFELLSMTDPAVDFIPSVCYEDTLGRHQRRFIIDNQIKAPQMLLNITNDGWFKSTPVVRQHLANARFRSVELRRHLARCSNTGASCLIDPFGNVTEPTHLEVPFETLADKRIRESMKKPRIPNAPVEFVIGRQVAPSSEEIVINTSLQDFKGLEGVLLSSARQRISVNCGVSQRELLEETLAWLPQQWPRLSITINGNLSDLAVFEEFYGSVRRKWPSVPITFKSSLPALNRETSDFIPNTFPTVVTLKNNPPLTVYAKFGDWFSLTALLFTILIVAIPAVEKNRATQSKSKN